MKPLFVRTILLASLYGMIGAALGGVLAASHLVINGQVASNDLKVINGRTYVPIGDVAKALGMSLSKSGDTLEMKVDGGAGQIANRNTGKLGDEIFTGRWRFKVLGIERADSYTLKETLPHEVLRASDGQEYIIVSCRVKNGTPKQDTLVFSTSSSVTGSHSAITDDKEQSYSPRAYDLIMTETYPDGRSFLPGAAIDFKMIFQVPKGMQPKDLIFTAMRYSMYTERHQKEDPPEDIRVALG